MDMLTGVLLGFAAWFILRVGLTGWYTVGPNQRAVKTVFGRAQRLGNLTSLDDVIADSLRETEKERYCYPQVRVIMPGGPYFKWPWEHIHKVSVATETANMAFDPESPSANRNCTVLDAVTKDQLNTGLTGQIRFQVSSEFEILETQRIVDGECNLTLVRMPAHGMLADMLTAEPVIAS